MSTALIEGSAVGSTEGTKVVQEAWDRLERYDAELLEKFTGIKGWSDSFTSCTITQRVGRNGASMMYPVLLRCVQEKFEALHKKEESTFNFHYRIIEKRPPPDPVQEARRAREAKIANQQAGGVKTFTSVYKEEKEKADEEENLKEVEEKLKKEFAAAQEERKQRGIRDFSQFIPDIGVWKMPFKEEIIYALRTGTTFDNAQLSFFVEGRGRRDFLQDFIDEYMWSIQPPPVKYVPPKKMPDNFYVYKYHVQFGWQQSARGIARSLESVVLPKETKDELLEDLDDFLNEENKKWFIERNIPYKKCYLFYGVPGSGKTSLLSVIAGMYRMCICYLTPTSAGINDATLRSAIQNLPQRGILVIEDVDALFGRDRGAKAGNGLTFSGMLNALDGIGMALGQVIILSTNFRDRLDPALIRNGRVDKHIKFDYIKRPEIARMFKIFYKGASKDEMEEFADNIIKGSDGEKISAATLQQVFVTCFKLKKEETVKVAEATIRKIIKSTRIDAGESGDAEYEKKQTQGLVVGLSFVPHMLA